MSPNVLLPSSENHSMNDAAYETSTRASFKGFPFNPIRDKQFSVVCLFVCHPVC